MAANERQHGGDHYRKLAIQHWDYVEANGIPYLEACAIKYLTRWRDKGGLEDLRKAIHFIEKWIEVEEARLQNEQKTEVKVESPPLTTGGTGFIPVGSDGRCTCTCATRCPLGKLGSEERCTESELQSHGINSLRIPRPNWP